jgi:ABC-2 type transport system permease protein
MTGFFPLLKKEMTEQWRTYRLLIIASVFLLFGITTPLMLKYLPEILKLSGETIQLEIPPPTAAQSLAEYAGSIGQIGVLVVVLVAMGTIATEIQRGTAVITLSKPVSYTAFVNAKFVAVSFSFLLSLVVASVVSFAYTVWLIGNASVAAFTGMNLLIGVFLLFSLSVTLLFSSLFKSSVAAGGCALGTVVAISLLSGLPIIGDFVPGKLLTWGNNLVNGSVDSFWGALGVTIALTVICLLLTPRMLRKKEI